MNQGNHNALAGIPVFIETNGYLLRSLTPNDATPELLSWLNSKEMLEGLNLPELNFTQEKLAKYIAQFDNYRNFFNYTYGNSRKCNYTCSTTTYRAAR